MRKVVDDKDRERLKRKFGRIKEEIKSSKIEIGKVGRGNRRVPKGRGKRSVRRKVSVAKKEVGVSKKVNPWDYEVENRNSKFGYFTDFLKKSSAVDFPSFPSRKDQKFNEVQGLFEDLLQTSNVKCQTFKRNLLSEKLKDTDFLVDIEKFDVEKTNSIFEEIYSILSSRPQFFNVVNTSYLASDTITLRSLKKFLEFTTKKFTTKISKEISNSNSQKKFSELMEFWSKNETQRERIFSVWEEFLQKEGITQ